MKTIRFLLAGTLILLLVTASRSQSYYFDNYSVKEGLEQSTVYNIHQDNDGFIWMGTKAGLSRFNGNEFINYSVKDGLAKDGVRALKVDKDGNFWLGHTGGGITVYNGKEFKELKHKDLKIESDVYSIEQDKEGKIWVSTVNDGVILIENIDEDFENFDFKIYSGKEGLSDRVFVVKQLSDGRLLFLLDHIIKEYDPGTDKFKNFNLDGLSYFSPITTIYEDPDKNIWFGTYTNGVQKYDKKKNKVIAYFNEDWLPDKWITSVFTDSRGDMWFGSWKNGVSKLSKNGEFTLFNTSNGLQNNKIWAITEDHEGNILIGTHESGLSISKGEFFLTYREDDGLSSDKVWSILRNNDEVWFGTSAGITVFNINDPSIEPRYYNKENNSGLESNEIKFIKKDKRGKIWVGTQGAGIYSFDANRNKFIMNYQVNLYVRDGNVTSLEVDKENNLWVGSVDGLIYYEINNERLARLSNADGLVGNDISIVHCDSKGNVWVGALLKGLSVIKGDKIEVALDTNITPSAIVEDRNGNLWIGTSGQGIYVFDGKQVIKTIEKQNSVSDAESIGSLKSGLNSNQIRTLNIDNQGDILIGTNLGMMKYLIEKDMFVPYSEKVGFTGIEVNKNASFQDNNDIVWFGTIKGVTRYNPTVERLNMTEPLTKIWRFRVNLKDRRMKEDMVLNYTENSLTFDFQSICITDPDAVEYTYMLEGVDPGWREPTKTTQEIYSSLRPGEYSFKLKAKSNTGIWNEKPITFNFKIKPPFWQRWWFISIVALTGFIIIYLYIKIRERNLKREKAILEQKVKERTKEIAQKNKELAKKNKDITDSINYARRIQSAIMRPENELTQKIGDSFIYYRAKDIVSGDFYWYSEKNDKKIIVAADCTGHGVPGAFMSMIGITNLNEIVNEKGITSPDLILNQLRHNIIETLQQGGEEGDSKDGMDLAMISLDKKNNLLEFSGAYNSLYMVRKGIGKESEKLEYNHTVFNDDLIEIKGSRMPIGVSEKMSQSFEKVILNVQPGDRYFITTDGYIDQFGGDRGKKFLSKRFKNLLYDIHQEAPSNQITLLERNFNEWKGKIEQIDDVLVIGLKI